MAKFEWYKEKVPENILIKQVYGIVFSDEGKVVLRVENNKYKLTGGKPENTDIDLKETLKREYLEELNIKIKDIHYLGFLLVEQKNKQYAQVRMIAKIDKIGNIKPDVDNGKIYKKFMASKENIKFYLNYSDLAGNQMIDDAINLANEMYNFKSSNSEYFI